MILFDSKSIAQIEQYYITNSGNSSLSLMDCAAYQFVRWISNKVYKTSPIWILCGHGNNGADGLVIAQKLNAKGYKINILLIQSDKAGTEEYQYHREKTSADHTISIHNWSLENQPKLSPDCVIIDAIFGIGLNRPAEGQYAELIKWANQSNCPIYAVDIPSGLYANQISDGPIIKARETLSFQWPKLSFLHRESELFTGKWTFVDIGIDTTSPISEDYKATLITKELIKNIIPLRTQNSHKGTFGHAHLVMGSYGMAGAAVLAAKGCLSTGVGLCTIISDKTNRNIIQSNVPEAIFKAIQDWNGTEKAIYGIGPGMGQSESSMEILQQLLQMTQCPMLFDADALNLLSAHKNLLHQLSPNSIITPHPKEFERLFGSTDDTYDRLELQKAKSREYQLVIVLKDHHTTITTPDGEIFYNNTGNSGMATGGSGDVLSGIIVGWLAQGLSPIHAALCGVYLAGLAADIALTLENEYTLTPSKTIEHMALAINQTLI